MTIGRICEREWPPARRTSSVKIQLRLFGTVLSARLSSRWFLAKDISSVSCFSCFLISASLSTERILEEVQGEFEPQSRYED